MTLHAGNLSHIALDNHHICLNRSRHYNTPICTSHLLSLSIIMAAHTKDKDHFILGLDYGTSYAGLGIIHVASFENGNQVETVME